MKQQFSLFNWDNISINVPTNHGDEKLFLCAQPDVSQIEEILYLSLINDFSLKEHLNNFNEIWIKPNITGMNRPDEGKTTQPFILECLIKVLKKITSKKIVVADSSVIGVDTMTAAIFSGIFSICEKHDIPFIDLRKISFKKITCTNYLLHHELDINEPFLDNNIFKINLAKIKTTYGSPVGMCLKNTKGVITDELKYAFHIKGLQKSICDLSEVVKWDLSILEGFPISELGQAGGVGPIGISTNPVVLDLLICLIFKIPLSEIFHIQHLAEKQNIKEDFFTKNDKINQIINLFGRIRYSSNGLKLLEEKFQLKIENGDACSGCVESLAKALKKTWSESLCQKRIILGAQYEEGLVQSNNNEIKNCFIGNCSFDRVGIELVKYDYSEELTEMWQTGLKVPGCPPTIDDMVDSLSFEENENLYSEKNKSIRIERSFNIQPIQISLFKEKYKKISPLVPPEKTSFSKFGIEAMIACEFISAAICHQMNWDFLRDSIFKAVDDGAEWWQPKNLIKFNESIIQDLFCNYEKKERIRAKERSEMVQSMSQIFTNGINRYSDIFNFNIDNEVIIKNILKAKVFSEDPEQKKLQVLLHNLAREDIVTGINSLCRPAIDYHIMRLYLRRGDITPNSIVGSEFLNNQIVRQSKTVSAFRSVIANALTYSSFCTNLSIPQINYNDYPQNLLIQ